MINASREFIEAVNSDRSDYRVSMILTTTAGSQHVFDITNEDIWDGTFRIEDATAPGEDFVIGAFVSTKLTFSLYNRKNDDDTGYIYDSYDFYNAVIDNLRLSFFGMETGITLGKFYVDNATFSGSLLTLTCTDGARFFNKPYSDSLSYLPTDPNRATLRDIVENAVTDCLGSTSYFMQEAFDNEDYTPDAFSQDSITFADVIAMCAQLAGCYAKFGVDGVLRFAWYPAFPTADPGEDELDPVYAEQHGYHVIKSFKTENLAKSSCHITKVTVTEEFPESETQKRDTKSYPAASIDDYVLSIEGNRLIGAGKAAEAAQMIGSCMITYRDGTYYTRNFRPFSGTALSNPLIESGDFAYIIDRDGDPHLTFITSRVFALGNGVALTCAGKAAPVNSQVTYSNTAKVIERTQKEIGKIEAEVAAAGAQLQKSIYNSVGLYESEETQQGGGVIKYFHDKEARNQSTYIWKFDADSIQTSTDGGQTWNAAIDAHGNAMLNYLVVDKLEANWIKTGTLDVDQLTVAGKLKDNTTPSNNFWNLNNGTFQFKNSKTLLNTDGLVLYYLGTGQPHTQFTSTIDNGTLTGKLAFYGAPTSSGGVYSCGPKLVEVDPDGFKTYLTANNNTYKCFEINNNALKFYSQTEQVATLDYGEIETYLSTFAGAGLHSIGTAWVGLFGGTSGIDNRDHHIVITNGSAHIVATNIHIGDTVAPLWNTQAQNVYIGGGAVTINAPTTITGALTLSAGLTVGTATVDYVVPPNSGQLFLGITGSSNSLAINHSTTHYNTMAGTLDMANNQIINANINGGSDARLKTHIKPATTDALKTLTAADLKSFDWLSDNRHVDVGLIAQQLREVAPGLVIEDKLGRLSIDMMGLVGYCVKAIQQLADRTGYDVRPTEWSDPYTLEDKQNFIKLTGGEL